MIDTTIEEQEQQLSDRNLIKIKMERVLDTMSQSSRNVKYMGMKETKLLIEMYDIAWKEK